MIYIMLLSICVLGIYMAYKDYVLEVFRWKWLENIFYKGKRDIELLIMKKSKSHIDKELYNSSVILKNLALVQRQMPFSADYMYERLVENSILLKPVYSQMLATYRSRTKKNAFKVLPLAVGTKASKNFAIILSKLEKLNPAELEKQMDVFQKSMMESRMTYAIKRVQRTSLILTGLATITVFALLLNFVVVVVFLNTIDTLNQLFI